eukprot:CAMPEP_0206140740 /NCGR_PEP_ID=MMETSP1473-20131121/10503_1 /ASSEMBLY_ACC=CAM_ASM_001109 /TAXON_ID=1461547 /ORGANISM="Stichococcus sp, Strain RCC1054" /LENGTH=567 /DNA_ID=CAMNT_0053535003 /DNA_START=347 /DNA_END=2050 /DNA_ORIENTATION=+
MHLQHEVMQGAKAGSRGYNGHETDYLVRSTAKVAEKATELATALKAKQARLGLHEVRPLLRDKADVTKDTTAEKDASAGSTVAATGKSESANDADWERRKQAVVGAMKHAWGSYVEYAWGHDELNPQAMEGKDGFGGVGATIVDSLDTLWLMGLKDEFAAAQNWTANELTFDRDHDSSVFETTIRVVGGLMAAHDLSGDAMFANRAKEIGDILMGAFQTPTGIPRGTINLRTRRSYNPPWAGGASGLSEFGSEQLEFIKLSDFTGNQTYARIVEGNIALLQSRYPDQGLLPYFISPQDGRLMNDHVTFGAMGDSYYEYLLKVWLLKGKSDDMYRDMWVAAMDEMIAKLIQYSSPSGLAYVAELNSGQLFHKMDHLACFVPGMLALGSAHGAVTGSKAQQYMELAENMTATCYQMYARQPTGLAPEVTVFNGRRLDTGAAEMLGAPAHNLLRPETVEALFVLWRTTHKPVYREWGWAIFQSFEKHCRVKAGYAGLRDVTNMPPEHDDTMQSFFLAETLKYLFLLFSDDEVLPLELWVLNTEAHPLRKVPDFKSTYRQPGKPPLATGAG